MRSLVKPEVLKQAAGAAAFSTLLAWPRLARWSDNPTPLWLAVVTLGWAAFCLWAAVFAWHEEYSGRPVLQWRVPAREWLLATLAGVIGAALFSQTIDPLGRALRPQDYPVNTAAWGTQVLFYLGFEQLFIYLAPLAFFLRLTRSAQIAVGATAVLRIFFLWLGTDLPRLAPSASGVLWLVLARVVATLVVLGIFLRGGLLPVCWVGLLLHARHWFAMEAGR